MFRKTLTIFSLIGLLLSVSLWVASYWIVALTIRWPSSTAIVYAVRGMGCASLGPQPNRNPRVEWAAREFQGLGTSFTWWFSRHYGHTAIQIPLYGPTLVFGGSFTYLGLPWYRHRKRRKLGLCLECGYDLRGSKERCPECNTPIDGGTRKGLLSSGAQLTHNLEKGRDAKAEGPQLTAYDLLLF